VMPGASLAAETEGRRWATLMPVLYTLNLSGYPVYPLGFGPPRTRGGAAMWRAISPALSALVPHTRWMRRMPGRINAARAELGLPRLSEFHGGITSYGTISDGLVLVATFPQLEYPRRWPRHVHVTGPMLFEVSYPELPLQDGDRPLIVVAASTSQEPGGLVGTALEALAEEPVRVVATTNRPGEGWSGPIPTNATVVDWVSYSQVMPRASVLVCNGGHGTVVRALAEGVPPLVSPLGGDQAENGARVTWAGAGLMLPARLLGPDSLRWSLRRLLTDGRFAARARAIAAWSRRNDGGARGAELVERYMPR
jgi:UDP:flavonoid glycosyltransferase YjiC (YdhE family)